MQQQNPSHLAINISPLENRQYEYQDPELSIPPPAYEDISKINEHLNMVNEIYPQQNYYPQTPQFSFRSSSFRFINRYGDQLVSTWFGMKPRVSPCGIYNNPQNPSYFVVVAVGPYFGFYEPSIHLNLGHPRAWLCWVMLFLLISIAFISYSFMLGYISLDII